MHSGFEYRTVFMYSAEDTHRNSVHLEQGGNHFIAGPWHFALLRCLPMVSLHFVSSPSLFLNNPSQNKTRLSHPFALLLEDWLGLSEIHTRDQKDRELMGLAESDPPRQPFRPGIPYLTSMWTTGTSVTRWCIRAVLNGGRNKHHCKQNKSAGPTPVP